jgi:hypothetical protein
MGTRTVPDARLFSLAGMTEQLSLLVNAGLNSTRDFHPLHKPVHFQYIAVQFFQNLSLLRDDIRRVCGLHVTIETEDALLYLPEKTKRRRACSPPRK